MPFFLLGSHKLRAFDGTIYEEKVFIERETEKARLVQIEKRGKVTTHWIPKSCCWIRTRPKIRIIEGKPTEVGQQEELVIKDWFWEKEIAGARGC